MKLNYELCNGRVGLEIQHRYQTADYSRRVMPVSPTCEIFARQCGLVTFYTLK